MTWALLAEHQEDLAQVLLATLGVIQTIALAMIADRSRRRRADDYRTRRRAEKRRARPGPQVPPQGRP